MLRSSLRLYQAATHISKTEFLDAISHVCPQALQNGGRKLALAISGGVDSMALAVMCREYLPKNGTELQGVIVDHGLRKSSDDEARKTKEVLELKLGIPSNIKRVYIQDSKQAVETQARTLRYTAIIEQCRSFGIQDVLVAHHSGDQYETMLMRLSQQGGSSIHIRGITRAPLSEEIFSKDRLDRHWHLPSSPELQCFGVKGVSSLNISLRRPLLGFSKDRLIATCNKFDIPWIEDQTNHDRRLTSRNAIRYILAQHKLPAALSEDSLWRLANSRNGRTAAIHEVAAKLFSTTNIKLDIRTGSAIIIAPTLEEISAKLPEMVTLSTALSAKSLPRVLAAYLGYLSQLVKPIKTQMRLVSQENREMLFRAQTNRTRFTCERTLFDPLSDGRWMLSRAPLPQNPFDPSLSGTIARFPHSSHRDAHFHNFDNRWWIKVVNPSSEQHVTLRYLRPGHLLHLKKRLKDGEIVFKDVADTISQTPRDLYTILDSLGPHDLRFSLPVLVTQSPAYAEIMSAPDWKIQLSRESFLADTNAETLLAFPTLNLRVHGQRPGATPSWIEGLEWEIYYKHLEHMEGRLDDSIVLPTTRESRGLV